MVDRDNVAEAFITYVETRAQLAGAISSLELVDADSPRYLDQHRQVHDLGVAVAVARTDLGVALYPQPADADALDVFLERVELTSTHAWSMGWDGRTALTVPYRLDNGDAGHLIPPAR